MPIKKKIFLITALLYVLYFLFPLFADTFNIPVWLPSVVTFLIMLTLYPRAFANKTFYWFLFYALVLTIYLLLGRKLTIGIGNVANSKKILIEFSYILPSISIFCILHYLNDEVIMRRFVLLSIGMLFASFVVAVPLMLEYKSLRAALGEQGEEVLVPGLPGYSLMHAYTLFLPMIGYGVKILRGYMRLLLLIGLLIICFVIYDTFVTTSLIIMVVVLSFTLLYSEKHVEWFYVVSSIIVVVFYSMYESGALIPVVDWMMPAFEGTAVEFKLNDIKDSMLQGYITGGSLTVRQDYHAISWESFFNSPIFGTSIVGGHSSLIDRFGGMGLMVGIPFLMIFISFIQKNIGLYKTKTARRFFWVGIIAGFVYLYEKGLWGSESWLVYMVLMPMGILTIENKVNSNGTKTT